MLNQSTHASVANSTASRLRHGPYFLVADRFDAQYAFIRRLTAFFWAADIVRRFPGREPLANAGRPGTARMPSRAAICWSILPRSFLSWVTAFRSVVATFTAILYGLLRERRCRCWSYTITECVACNGRSNNRPDRRCNWNQRSEAAEALRNLGREIRPHARGVDV